MSNQFFAMMSRMKYINRWALMRNTQRENICEHSLNVAMVAHNLAVISNVRLGSQLSVEKAALLAMYHDCAEIITGDMPTPIKYHSEDLHQAFQEVENLASAQLLKMLPEDMRSYYEALFFPEEEDAFLWKLVKAADKISAYCKCIEEEKSGNSEFRRAKETIKESLLAMELKEVAIFMEEFMPAFEMTLDEL
ncbi:5'-deoxynucleotidase [[Clostridium] polysaccharolyticum]|jgi:5'-deoxynucleotidase|uniref:5'-deoxynucleotidase n=1 Tax=[Clostridium] polysaccharolyticum TaxID=29364 RepID=A0A1I0EQ60_9FIRM|nr:5'-deoxynucleotidase [[Clostridium] polysaccharolyticum]SET47168.1 5'-deoxynucleotidase [[Clostridium] polysaccharolyticum]